MYKYGIYVYKASHALDATPDSVFVMQSFNHILVIILKYGETNIKIISTHYLFYKKSYPNCLSC